MTAQQTPRTSERVAGFARLAQVGIAAAIISLAINAMIRMLAVEVFEAPSDDQPLVWAAIVVVTVLASAVGTALYWLLSRFTQRPVTIFRIVAVIALLLSLAGPLTTPDLATESRVAGAAMHIVVAIVLTALLTTAGRVEPGRAND